VEIDIVVVIFTAGPPDQLPCVNGVAGGTR